MRPLLLVETNFVNGLVLERDGAEVAQAAQTVVRLAREGDIDLVLPAFSLMEAEFTFRSASKGRNRKVQEFLNDERELGRSLISQDAKREYEAFRVAYLEVSRRESARYDAFYTQAVESFTLAPLDQAVLAHAPDLVERFDVSLADAVVFASCLSYLEQRPADGLRMFLTQDRQGFDKEGIREELRGRGAELILDPRAVLNRIR